MTKRKSATATKREVEDDVAVRLRTTLEKQQKSALIDVLIDLAKDEPRILRQLANQFGVASSPDKLEAATRQAIADATAFDERQINHNFDYDYDAYELVKRNFGRLIGAGKLRLVMNLALELMELGSCQVEMSDEGLMTDDIEGCFEVVLQALAKSDLPPDEITAWCAEMRNKDRVRCIANGKINALQKRFQT